MILGGDGAPILGGQEVAIRGGSRDLPPAGTGIAHAFRAGTGGLTLLAYGTRETGDLCYYRRRARSVSAASGIYGRIERLDYWDGED